MRQTCLEKMLLAGLSILILSGPSLAAEWARIYSGIDNANSIQQTSDGGYVVAGGVSVVGLYPQGIFAVLKLNGEGFIEWQKDYGPGPANSIQETLDGGYVVTGWTLANTGTLGVVPMFSPPPAIHIWILKLNRDGGITWQQTYVLSFTEKAYSIRQTSDGGFILTGTADSNTLILRLDPSGSIQWQKTYGPGTFYSIQQASDGGFIAAGSSYSFGAGNGDAWVMKLDKNGDIQWQKTYGGTGSDGASSVQQTSDGGYVIAGSTSSFGAGNNDAWVMKLDRDGNIQWQKTYGGTGPDGASSVQQSPDGGYIIAGSTSSFGAGNSDVWVVKLDRDGNIQWQKTYGGPYYEGANSIAQTLDGGYIVGGFSGIGSSFFVLKLDGNGEIPGCSIVGKSNAIVKDTEAIVKETSVAGVDTNIIPETSHASPTNTHSTEYALCTFPSDIDMVINPTEINFNTLLLGEYADRVATVTNAGMSSVGIGKMSSTPPFSILNDNCSEQTLVPGGSCAVTMRFSPAWGADSYEFIIIPFDDPNETIGTIFLSGTGARIDLSTPENGISFDACSSSYPPTFAWRTLDPYESFEIQFSSDKGFSSIPIKVRAQGNKNDAKMTATTWKKILAMSEENFYTRVIGKSRSYGYGSGVNTYFIEPAHPVANPGIANTNKHSLPLLSWANSCNRKFKIPFGSDEDFSQNTAVAFNVNTASSDEGDFTKRLTLGQWKAIKKLVDDKTGATIYWYVESWDGSGRYGKTNVMSFVLTE